MKSALLAALAATRILFIGDSHSVGPFGQRLDDGLRTLGAAEVWTYARCGSSPDWWYSGKQTHCGFLDRPGDGSPWRYQDPGVAPTPLLAGLLAVPPGKFARTLTIIELGTNQIGEPAAEALASLRRMAGDVVKAGSECAWIGPPRMRRFTNGELADIYALLKQSPCRVIDSRELTSYPAKGGDGIHYEFPEAIPIARAWADAVFSDIKTHSFQKP